MFVFLKNFCEYDQENFIYLTFGNRKRVYLTVNTCKTKDYLYIEKSHEFSLITLYNAFYFFDF